MADDNGNGGRSNRSLMTVILSTSGTVALAFAGLFYLIDSRVAQAVGGINISLNQLTTIQTSTSQQLNSRFDQFQESIKSLREIAQDQQKSIGTLAVASSQNTDAISVFRSELKVMTDKDFSSQLAGMLQRVEANGRRLDKLDASLASDHQRQLDAASRLAPASVPR